MSRFPRFLPSLVIFLVLLLVIGAANYPSSSGEENAPVIVRGVAPEDDNGVSPGFLSPRDQAVAWIAQARTACAQVRDYRCVLTTRERVRSKLQAEQVMDMAFRAEPLAVHLRFTQPSASAGQEVWFAVGSHNNQMRVRPAGYLGALTGLVTLDPHSPRVRENSRHAITDAGFARMLERFAEAGRDPTVPVRCFPVMLEDRAHRCIEWTSEGATEWQRAILYLDAVGHLPVRVEYHDREGRLFDEATYRQIRLNVGLTNADFGG